jgi:hypothetical protein
MSEKITIKAARSVLAELEACSESREWLDGFRGSVPRAWAACARGDWLLWLAARVGVDRRLIVLAACDIAETALIHVPAVEDRPRIAIETARRWARGEATVAELRAAAYAAAYAASASATHRAAVAAYATHRAAASASADADAYATHRAAAYVAEADASARASSLRASAEIVRRHIPADVIVAALRGGASAPGQHTR